MVVEELCGTSVSKSTVSKFYKKPADAVNDFKNRQLNGIYKFILTDAKYFKVRENHSIVSKAFMLAIGIAEDGGKKLSVFTYMIMNAKRVGLIFSIVSKEESLMILT